LVHYKAVRKPLVAIILNILSTMFYSRLIQNLAFTNMTASDSVSPSPKGGLEPARPLSKSATVSTAKIGLKYFTKRN